MTATERSLLALVLALTAAAGACHYAGAPETVSFIVAALALAGIAWSVSLATEQIGMSLGPGMTGLLQSTVGNLPEFFVVIFALQAHDTTIAETAIIGSILVNALLVLGMVLIAGSVGAEGGVMRFSARLPNDTATLLLISSITIGLIALVTTAHDPASHHTQTISIVGAVVLLIVYCVWVRQYLRSDAQPGEVPDATLPAAEASTPQGHSAVQAERPRIALGPALALLLVAGVGSAFVSDWFIDALEPTIHRAHISQALAGIVIVAIAGNAVEHVVGVYLAARGKSDLAIAVVKNSVAQIAAFLYPLLVLVSLLTASRLTFALPPVWAAALFGTALLIWQITGDGEATPFEGSALIAVYIVLAVIAGFEH